jgi:hypothetical protein
MCEGRHHRRIVKERSYSCRVSGLLEPRLAADDLQRPLRSRFRPQLSASVIAPRKLGVSCRVKVPVGSGLAPPPVASLASMAEPWRHGEQDGRSVDSVAWRPPG